MTVTMKRVLTSLTLCASITSASSAHADCADLWDWLDPGCRRVVDTWTQGKDEILVSGYAYHLPGTWTAERRAELNANAWGAGYGRTVEEANGDTHTVFY